MIGRTILSLLLTCTTLVSTISEAGTPPSPPSALEVTSIRPWPGVSAPVIDPSFVIGTTGVTLGSLTSLSGGTSYTLPEATTSTLGGVTVSTGLNISNGSISVIYGTTAGTSVQGNDSRITGALQSSLNLSDVQNVSTTRTNLGLGNLAIANYPSSGIVHSNGNTFTPEVIGVGLNENNGTLSLSTPGTSTLGGVIANPGTTGQYVTGIDPTTGLLLYGTPSGSGITALTGDVSASGTGSVTTTLATVNPNVGTFQGITTNGKGLITGAGPGEIDLGSAYLTQVELNGASGTTLNRLAKFSTGGKVVTIGSGDTQVVLAGICVSGCGTTGSATLATQGSVPCYFNGATTAGDFVIGAPAGGACSDGGATLPTGVNVIGVINSTHAAAGVYNVDMNFLGVSSAAAKTTTYTGTSPITVTGTIISCANATTSSLGCSEAGTGLTASGGSYSVSYGTTAGTAVQGNDSRVTGALQSSALGVSVGAQVGPSVLTATGTVGAGVQTAIANCSTSCTISLPSSANDGWVLNVKRWGTGSVIVSGVIDGASTTITLSNPLVKENVGFVWSTTESSWVQVN